MNADIARVVIVGGGQAAGWAAKTLRDLGYHRELSVVADEDHDFYERPPLSKEVLAGTMEADNLRLFSPDVVKSLDIQWHRPCKARAIDRAARMVSLDNGRTLAYDRLLIATGSRPRLPDPAWSTLDGVMVLRTVADAQAMRQRLAHCRRLAVVGGGWIGLEVAALARSKGIEVVVYERGDRLCGRNIGSEVAEHLAGMHQGQGVELRLDCGELTLAQKGTQTAVTTPFNEALYDLVLVGAGAQLNVELAQDAGLVMDGGIVVDGAGRTSDPAIYAAGDVAVHPVHGLCVQSWANAQNQAVAAAHGMLGMPADYGDEPWLWSDQYGINVQILGVRSPDTRCVRRTSEQAADVYFYLDEQSRLRQMVSFGDPRAIKLGRRWMARAQALDAAALADPQYDLMALR